MTRRDKLACVHEPFGDAFYYGPERVGERFEDDAEGREKSGFAETTYADVLKQVEDAGREVCLPQFQSIKSSWFHRSRTTTHHQPPCTGLVAELLHPS